VRLISRVKDVKELAGERDALSSAIEKTHDSKRLINLINCLVAATKAAGTSTQSSADVALLLRKVSELRAKNEYETFASDTVELVRLGGVTMPVDHVGLIYAAVLLEPISADGSNRLILTDYEDLLRKRGDDRSPKQSWGDDVWSFATWARTNLPGFDPHASSGIPAG
jgi:hypothetical protein